MALLSLMGFLGLQSLIAGKESLLTSAQDQRRQVLVLAQIERDLLPMNRMRPNERLTALTLADSRLRTPAAIWQWSPDGLTRTPLNGSGALGDPLVYWTGDTQVFAEYVGVGGVPDQTAPIGSAAANPRLLSIVIERRGLRIQKLFYIGPFE